MEHSKEYEELFSQYSKKSNDELEKIANSGNEYREVAKQVAIDILNSDRVEYKENLKKAEIQERKLQEKEEATQNHPLIGVVSQIANDLRFLKNVVIVLIVLYVLGILFIAINLI